LAKKKIADVIVEVKNTINDFPKASATRQILKDPTCKEMNKQLSLSWRDQIALRIKDNLGQTNQNVDLP
jgi:hypothetical protein